MQVHLNTKSTDVRCDQGHTGTIPKCLGEGFSGFIQVTDGRRRDLVIECGDGSPFRDIKYLVDDIIDDLEERAPGSQRCRSFDAIRQYVPSDLIPIAYDTAPNGQKVERVLRRSPLAPCCPQCGSTNLEVLAVRKFEETPYLVIPSSHWADIPYRERRTLAERSLERMVIEHKLPLSEGLGH